MVDILVGYLLDLLVGDPYWFPHPVRMIGKMIECGEKVFRKVFTGEKGEKIGGFVLVVAVVGITYVATYGLLEAAKFSRLFYHLINSLLIYFVLATRSLGAEAGKVYRALKAGDIPLARKMLSRIVGRDTQHLDEQEVIRAAVETVAENTSDGVVAPLFYIFLGGAPLGMAYKAINTLDSMVGYKDSRYINFGWASARVDDLANYIPARITAVLLIFASVFCLKCPGRSWQTVLRDGRNHSSLNSGYPEAAVAGALGIQLGGSSYYAGRKVDKPTIGDPVTDKKIEDIKAAIKLMYVASFLAVVCFAVLAWILSSILK